jgi:LmbE family N-acetylglucosaminyl deacetylase
MRAAAALCACLLLATVPAPAQRDLAGAGRIQTALDKLQVLGSVLYIGAHPDDENTALLAYFARGRKVRTAYLSLTRGEGGQNLIGSEQSERLGLIRTQELLAARKIDGAEQYFTRAVDFGYSKTAEETLRKWGREKILADVVWGIRRFQPDVIVLRFSGTGRDGHGHHQASALLAREAFAVAADRSRFPEQLQHVQPWQAKRLLWNSFDRSRDGLSVETGEFNPVLGYSYAEIGGMSRSMHRSQGFGAPERKGGAPNSFTLVAGEPAAKDLFAGIDLTWTRVPGGEAVGGILAEVSRTFRPEAPERVVPLLLKARAVIAALPHPWAARKLAEVDEAIALAAGLWLDATAERATAVPGSDLRLTAVALNRSRLPLVLSGIRFEGAVQAPVIDVAQKTLGYNESMTYPAIWKVPAGQPYSQPYWLERPRQGDTYAVADSGLIGVAENPPVLMARFRLRLESAEFELSRPVAYRWVDRVLGELRRPLAVVPPVAVQVLPGVRMFPDASAKKIEVQVRANVADAAGTVHLMVPAGWSVRPQSREFRLSAADEQTSLPFEVTPPPGVARQEIHAVAEVMGREISVGTDVIRYPHIPVQTTFPPATAELVRTDVQTLARRIGYVMGAGDAVPQALAQLGCEVTLLEAEDLAQADLNRFDAIVTGVRAYNTRPDLRASQARLLEYVAQGGTLLVQYNVLEGGFLGGDPSALEHIGPYPIHIGRGRVAVEEAPVEFPNPRHPLLTTPNQITSRDFEGWVQERGLYFAAQWDPRYETLFESHDPGEPPQLGGTLVARYGKGAYVFTGYSWFRELPAGVPGAFRIFANLLSAGKVLR